MEMLDAIGLSPIVLQRLSYRSTIGVSLKKNLHYFNKEILFVELNNVVSWYNNSEMLDEISAHYRVKSIESITKKYNRCYPNSQVRKTFNDILGFRVCCDSYNNILSFQNKNFRIADMTNGKAKDDGYRGLHLYYQNDNTCYPIEIQVNTYNDRIFNDWLHKYLYKTNDATIGKNLRKMHEEQQIQNENDFKEELNNVLLNRKA